VGRGSLTSFRTLTLQSVLAAAMVAGSPGGACSSGSTGRAGSAGVALGRLTLPAVFTAAATVSGSPDDEGSADGTRSAGPVRASSAAGGTVGGRSCEGSATTAGGAGGTDTFAKNRLGGGIAPLRDAVDERNGFGEGGTGFGTCRLGAADDAGDTGRAGSIATACLPWAASGAPAVGGPEGWVVVDSTSERGCTGLEGIHSPPSCSDTPQRNP
jgi:hypothetical protein